MIFNSKAKNINTRSFIISIKLFVNSKIESKAQACFSKLLSLYPILIQKIYQI